MHAGSTKRTGRHPEEAGARRTGLFRPEKADGLPGLCFDGSNGFQPERNTPEWRAIRGYSVFAGCVAEDYRCSVMKSTVLKNISSILSDALAFRPWS